MNESGEIQKEKLAEAINYTNYTQPKKMQLTIYDLKKIMDGKIADMLIEKDWSLKKNSSNFYIGEKKNIPDRLVHRIYKETLEQ